jgi:hypothetical protein
MAPSKADAVLGSVLASTNADAVIVECGLDANVPSPSIQQLRDTAVPVAPRRRILEIVAPDGRSLVTLERRSQFTEGG